MYLPFFICVTGVFSITPLYFLSVEHLRLQEKFGKEKGIKIGELLGIISGWGFFLFWSGIWFSPQPRFAVPILQNHLVQITAVAFSIPLFHLAIFAPLFTAGAWLGIKGVQKTTLRTAETHRPEKIATKGVYSIVRHPQYLGGLLAHVGISFLLSAWYCLLSTPLIAAIIYAISWKEEKELVKEFGKEYEDYKIKVPMLIPRPGRQAETS